MRLRPLRLTLRSCDAGISVKTTLSSGKFSCFLEVNNHKPFVYVLSGLKFNTSYLFTTSKHMNNLGTPTFPCPMNAASRRNIKLAPSSGEVIESVYRPAPIGSGKRFDAFRLKSLQCLIEQKDFYCETFAGEAAAILCHFQPKLRLAETGRDESSRATECWKTAYCQV